MTTRHAQICSALLCQRHIWYEYNCIDVRTSHVIWIQLYLLGSMITAINYIICMSSFANAYVASSINSTPGTNLTRCVYTFCIRCDYCNSWIHYSVYICYNICHIYSKYKCCTRCKLWMRTSVVFWCSDMQSEILGKIWQETLYLGV